LKSRKNYDCYSSSSSSDSGLIVVANESENENENYEDEDENSRVRARAAEAEKKYIELVFRMENLKDIDSDQKKKGLSTQNLNDFKTFASHAFDNIYNDILSR